MFYSEAILSRRGPLAKVWLAAHMERKLSKTQTLQTDIEQSVDAIVGQEVEVMALRLSGQLLLGVVRIYSRKAKYLLDDCNEALLKIKLAFRPGVVDMTEEQLIVNKNAITLQVNNLDLDALLPDINWDINFEERPIQAAVGDRHIARKADITLETIDNMQFDFEDHGYGFDLGPSDGIGSQDFELDLGLDFGTPKATDRELSVARTVTEGDESVEVGRDAAPRRHPRDSLASHLMGRPGGEDTMDVDALSYRSRDLSVAPFGGDMDLGFGPDLGDLDLGISFDDVPAQPELQLPADGAPVPQLTESRASSPLTEPPQTPPPVEAALASEAAKGKGKKVQKQIIDAVTELADRPGTRGRAAGPSQPATDISSIVTSHAFIPRSPLVMRLTEIREDPIAHFLPTTTTSQGIFFCAAPPGLAPELREMFMRPVPSLPPTKRKHKEAEEGAAAKKQRRDGSVVPEGEEDVDPVEDLRRRASSVAGSVALGSDILGRRSVEPGFELGDTTGITDDFHMQVEDEGGPGFEFDVGAHLEQRERSKSILSDLTRLSTPVPENPLEEGEEKRADAGCPIATFDERSTQASDPRGEDGKGYSKNTVKALRIIRSELSSRPIPPLPFSPARSVISAMEDEEAGEKVMSFQKMSTKASRRAASSFFFELLVIGTRDCIKVAQDTPYGDIGVKAKDKLWERQRGGSMAPSVSSAFPGGSSQMLGTPIRGSQSQLSELTPSVLGRTPSAATGRTPLRTPVRQGSVVPSIGSSFGL